MPEGFDWGQLLIVLAALTAGWTILKTVLRLTMRAFAIGCTGLLVVVAIAFVALYGK